MDVHRALASDLTGKRALVVMDGAATLTSAMCAWILETAGFEPGFVLGAVANNFGLDARPASTRRKILGVSAPPAPLVVEGRFVDREAAPGGAVVVIGAAEAPPKHHAGLVVCDARHPKGVAIAARDPDAKTTFYGLDEDLSGEVVPTWQAAVVTVDPTSGAQPFDLYAGGSYGGRFALKLRGAENVRHAVAAIAACAEGFGVHIEKARSALATFDGVRIVGDA
jgi:UDP-N-acetylmuramate: L-alanyl-gamma-D-glutamyl-meso-diaminopimelate ligase